MKKIRWKLLAAALALFALGGAAMGTLAFFSAENTAHNVITSGGVDITLREWADEDKTEPFEDLEDMVPGMTATKIVEVENTGASAAWIRVSVDPYFADGNLAFEYVTIDYNEDDWTRDDDGYYYYNLPLAPGGVTAPLFTEVAFAETMPNAYQNSTLHVDVLAQAVQTANNGETALAANGWPEQPQE